MLKIFICSHGHMASGIKSSVEILLGSSSNITAFDAYVDKSSVQEHLDSFYKTVDKNDRVFLLSDLYGGSVNSAMYLYLDKPNTTLIAGINLALVLELANRKDITTEEIDELVDDTRKMMKIVKLNDDSNESIAEKDDFF